MNRYPTVAAILRRARQRYHGSRLPYRPALVPTSVLGLFPLLDLIALAKAGAWPLSKRQIRQLVQPPRARRRRRWYSRMAALVRKIIASDLPEALNVLKVWDRR
jgi:hypothetical protein